MLEEGQGSRGQGVKGSSEEPGQGPRVQGFKGSSEEQEAGTDQYGLPAGLAEFFELGEKPGTLPYFRERGGSTTGEKLGHGVAPEMGKCPAFSPRRVFGRVREPVRQSFERIRDLFDRQGMLVYLGREGDGHELLFGPKPELKPPKRWVNLVLFLATILTTLLVGSLQMGRNPFANPLDLVHGIPFSLAIILILGSHELGHYFTARRLGVDATLPYFLPVPHPMTGTMGAFIKIRSVVPSKGALVKVGVAGPLVGFVVALPVTLVGLYLSKTVTVAETGTGLQLGSSLVFGLLSWIRFGSLPEGTDVMLHPVAFAGWLGFFVTALNLLPAGQLDGGHIVYAVAGRFRKVLNWVVIAALLGMGFFWLGWPLWAVLIAVFGLRHPRPLDDVSPLSRSELALAIAGLVVFVLTFMPAPFGALRV